jgi:hypothetical protein
MKPGHLQRISEVMVLCAAISKIGLEKASLLVATSK